MIDKKFLKPTAEVITFANDEIIIASGPDGQVDEIPIGEIPTDY